MQSDFCTFHAKKLRSNSRIEIPGTANLCRGFRLEGFRCFSKTLLLHHRPASYGRIVVGIGESVGPNSKTNFIFPKIIIFITRIIRSCRIFLRSCENTAVRPVIEYNFNPMHHIQTRRRRRSNTSYHRFRNALSGKHDLIFKLTVHSHRNPMIAGIHPDKMAYSRWIHILSVVLITTAQPQNYNDQK